MLAERSFVLGAVSSFLLAGAMPAEIVDIPSEYLADQATHIITAEVQKIESTEADQGAHRVKSYTTTVQVRTVEKGKGLAPGEVIKIHYWTQKRIDGELVPDTGGYRGLPAEKEVVRICLVNQGQSGAGVVADGSFHVVFPNGFLGDAARPSKEVLPDKKDMPASHVLTGQVQKIAVRTEVQRKTRVSYYTADFKVIGVEKGSGVAAEETVRLLYWTQKQDVKKSAVPIGYRDIPKEGDKLRVRLVNAGPGGVGVGRAGEFQASPDGFEKLAP